MQTKFLISELIQKLNIQAQKEQDFSAFVGLDGFVDHILKVVLHKSQEQTRYFQTMKEFGQYIINAAGKSSELEIISQQTKFGGNAPIMANALAHLNLQTHLTGIFGYPDINPLFQKMHPEILIHSVGDPGTSSALEFNDGKLILSDFVPIEHLDWTTFIERVNQEKLVKHLKSVELIALVDWSNLSHGTSLWKNLLEQIILPAEINNKIFFFDLADLSAKSSEQVRTIIQVISSYGSQGKVILGLNENEAEKLYAIYQDKIPDQPTSLKDLAQYLFQAIQIEYLVIHPLDRSLLVSPEGIYELPGQLVEQPKIITGGGDHFNAGICLGHLLQLNPEEMLLLGMATSGAYVQNGYSPSWQDLIIYLEQWEAKH
ncbi:MAG: hypothetical protein ACNS62_09890 [Candidatus Cyclobacteriaceae bacterium M3_2C_046]